LLVIAAVLMRLGAWPVLIRPLVARPNLPLITDRDSVFHPDDLATRGPYFLGLDRYQRRREKTMMDWGGWSAAGWVLMSVGMLAFWALVIFGIVWLVRTTGDQRGFKDREERRESTPIEALDRSLAEGKIEVEDYRERRRALTGST
jgi:putative membrane protein